MGGWASAGDGEAGAKGGVMAELPQWWLDFQKKYDGGRPLSAEWVNWVLYECSDKEPPPVSLAEVEEFVLRYCMKRLRSPEGQRPEPFEWPNCATCATCGSLAMYRAADGLAYCERDLDLKRRMGEPA